ncbi:hypothetical protein CC78DRAFT_547040 [Lojkania enalia]|uniref:Uncharacterized protein n=1 Tax=Lojkania enalia TaxID=147567 RepID=A0A9P4K1P0_9PLEO|nr:hypothetical protein CC78DRAFT_547040 [Didymosphaeria enalia]
MPWRASRDVVGLGPILYPSSVVLELTLVWNVVRVDIEEKKLVASVKVVGSGCGFVGVSAIGWVIVVGGSATGGRGGGRAVEAGGVSVGIGCAGAGGVGWVVDEEDRVDVDKDILVASEEVDVVIVVEWLDEEVGVEIVLLEPDALVLVHVKLDGDVVTPVELDKAVVPLVLPLLDEGVMPDAVVEMELPVDEVELVELDTLLVPLKLVPDDSEVSVVDDSLALVLRVGAPELLIVYPVPLVGYVYVVELLGTGNGGVSVDDRLEGYPEETPLVELEEKSVVRIMLDVEVVTPVPLLDEMYEVVLLGRNPEEVFVVKVEEGEPVVRVMLGVEVVPLVLVLYDVVVVFPVGYGGVSVEDIVVVFDVGERGDSVDDIVVVNPEDAVVVMLVVSGGDSDEKVDEVPEDTPVEKIELDVEETSVVVIILGVVGRRVVPLLGDDNVELLVGKGGSIDDVNVELNPEEILLVRVKLDVEDELAGGIELDEDEPEVELLVPVVLSGGDKLSVGDVVGVLAVEVGDVVTPEDVLVVGKGLTVVEGDVFDDLVAVLLLSVKVLEEELDLELDLVLKKLVASVSVMGAELVTVERVVRDAEDVESEPYGGGSAFAAMNAEAQKKTPMSRMFHKEVMPLLNYQTKRMEKGTKGSLRMGMHPELERRWFGQSLLFVPVQYSPAIMPQNRGVWTKYDSASKWDLVDGRYARNLPYPTNDLPVLFTPLMTAIAYA